MVKRAKAPKRGKVKRANKTNRQVPNRQNPTFGAVSTINTAPIAIGNSISGMRTQVLPTTDGVRAVGRDFCFDVASTGTVYTWVLAGGIPLTPACLPSSILRNCMTMYNRFKIRGIRIHYITAAPTSQAGQILFHVRRNEGSALPSPVSATFLPFVMSDGLTVMGPQWLNHTMTIDTRQMPWLSCDYGATSESETYSQYDVLLYSKTSAANSPGYVLMDYDYEFRELAINPRTGNLAAIAGSEAQWSQVAFGSFGNLTVDTSTLVGTEDTTGMGGITLEYPDNNIGDVYEFAVDNTNSTYSGAAAATFAKYSISASDGAVLTAFTMSDGMILYYVMVTTSTARFYQTKDAAFSTYGVLKAGATVNYGSTIIRGYSKRIGSVSPSRLIYSQ